MPTSGRKHQRKNCFKFCPTTSSRWVKGLFSQLVSYCYLVTFMPNPDPLDLHPATDVSEPGRSSDLHGLIRLVLEKAWLIVSCLVLAVVAVTAYVERTPRIYQATTTVQVEQEDAKVVKVEKVVSEDMRSLEILNTVAQKLCNGSLVEKVLAVNNLLPPEGAFVTNGSRTISREDIITGFSKSIKATLRRNTRLIDITVRSTNPQ